MTEPEYDPLIDPEYAAQVEVALLEANADLMRRKVGEFLAEALADTRRKNRRKP